VPPNTTMAGVPARAVGTVRRTVAQHESNLELACL
jgi:serine acetyltransferase